MELVFSLVVAAMFCLIAAVIEFFVDRKSRPNNIPGVPTNRRRRRRDKWSPRKLSER
jgi:hypothetical protein